MVRIAVSLVLLLGSVLALEVEETHVKEALDQAGANRSELERVLAHFAKDPDPRLRSCRRDPGKIL